MDYGALPPEVNSARMYTGPGSEPMLTAAAAWTTLADELRSIATGYSSTISTLGTAWQGSASARMTAAAVPYITWLTTTAEHAQQTAIQAKAAANSYETAFAATVPPPTIAANRAQLASLVSTNIVGQNTAAIASTEADYVDMWAQDTAAMYVYAGQSATAAHVTPFNPPPHTTNPAATTAQTTLPGLLSTTPNALQSLATPTTNSASPAEAIYDLLGGPLTPGGLFVIPSTPEFLGVDSFGVTLEGGGLTSKTAPVRSPGPGAVASASTGRAGLVGGLSVPPSWGSAAPTIRTAAAMLPQGNPAVVPAEGNFAPPEAVAANGHGSRFSNIVASGLAGRAIAGTGGQATRFDRTDNAVSAADSAARANIFFVTPEVDD